MKLPGSIKNKETKEKNGKNTPHLEITEVILVYCNVVNNCYQQGWIVLYAFVPNKTFVKLLEISLTNSIFLKTFNSEFQAIEVWLTDQNSKPLETENKFKMNKINSSNYII